MKTAVILLLTFGGIAGTLFAPAPEKGLALILLAALLAIYEMTFNRVIPD
jgi:hypothetical protein